MKQFFKFVLASMVGFIIAGGILLIICVMVIAGIFSSANDKSVTVDSNSILQLKFNYAITERTPNNPLSGLGFLGIEAEKTVGLNDILANIKKAKTDPNIKGIFLDESEMSAGQATIEEIRNALIDFKK